MLETVTNIGRRLERPRDQTGKGRIDIRDVSASSLERQIKSSSGRIDAPADQAGEFVCLLVPRVRKINTA